MISYDIRYYSFRVAAGLFICSDMTIPGLCFIRTFSHACLSKINHKMKVFHWRSVDTLACLSVSLIRCFCSYRLKGALMFTCIVLIGTGFFFVKQVLSTKEKRIFMIVIPLQVFLSIKLFFDYPKYIGMTHCTFQQVQGCITDQAISTRQLRLPKLCYHCAEILSTCI